MTNINDAGCFYKKILNPVTEYYDAHFSLQNLAFLGNVGSVGFSPSDIAGLKLFLDAGLGITKDGGDLISDWADQSGTGNDVAQATGSAQPLFVSSVAAFNNLPTVRFVSADSLFRTAFVSAPITTGFSIYMVCSDPSSINGFYFDGVTDRAALLQDANPHLDFFTSATVNSTTAPSGAAAVIYRIIYDGASSSLFRDGSSISTGNDGAGDMDGISLASNASQGANINMDISEYLIYDNVLSAGDNTLLMNFLTGKYAL